MGPHHRLEAQICVSYKKETEMVNQNWDEQIYYIDMCVRVHVYRFTYTRVYIHSVCSVGDNIGVDAYL